MYQWTRLHLPSVLFPSELRFSRMSVQYSLSCVVPDLTGDRLVQNTLAFKFGLRLVYLLSTFLVCVIQQHVQCRVF